MAAMDRRKLASPYFLQVSDISFASTAIGHATAGRTAESTWAKGDNVIFSGQLQHILVFALLGFDVSGVSIGEKFQLVPARDFRNLSPSQDITVISLDPAEDEGIVVDADVTFLDNLTGGYRRSWDEVQGIVIGVDGAATKEYWHGSLLTVLAYSLQYPAAGTAPIYTDHNFALFSKNGGMNFSTIDLLSDSAGPVELEKAHLRLGEFILNVAP